MKNWRNAFVRMMSATLAGLMLLSSCVPAEPAPEETDMTDEPIGGTVTEKETETLLPPEGEETKLPAGVQAKRVYCIDVPDAQGVALTWSTLQGLAAKHSENQIIMMSGAVESYLPYLENWDCEVKNDVDGEPITLAKMAELYKKEGFIKGYILTPLDVTTDDTWDVAVSLAGVLDAVVVTDLTRKIFDDLGYECLLDTAGKDDAWLRASEYWDLLNRDVALVQTAHQVPRLIDYAVKCGAYMKYYRGQSQKEHMEIFDFLNDNAVVLGYNNTLGEYDTVESLSNIHVSMIPADHAYNISTLSGFRIDSMKQKRTEAAAEEEETKKVHTVCVILSDGDNMQWVLNDFSSSRWYGSPLRGNVTMGWGLPAMSVELISPMMAGLYDTMTERDEFIMQLSGLGYTFPSKWKKEVRLEMAKELAGYMRRSDFQYAEILDAGGFEESVLEDFTAQDGIEGLFYIDYANYAGHSGRIIWTNGKPTVAARYRLWGGLEDGSIDMISRRINRATTDPTKEGAYSFIIAHAWSGMTDGKFGEGGSTMEAIAALIESFDEDVEVVTPSEFMRRIKANLGEGKPS